MAVHPAPNLHRISAALFLLPLLAAPLAAQHVLLAEDAGKLYVVCAARGPRPYVEKDGKVESIDTHRFVLREVPEYLPAFISVRDISVRTTSMTIGLSGQQINNNFFFDATFESMYRLKDVFLVLYLDTEREGKAIFLSEIGNMEPDKAVPISIGVPVNGPLGSGNYSIYVFAGHSEVLQSMIPFGVQEAALDRMVAKRVENVRDAAPRLFIGPFPKYPPSLKKANIRGQALISLRIGANGGVYNPKVASATDPAFGEVALTAVRLWRFLPKVKDGIPVETQANVPFNFAPPDPVKGGP